MLTMPRRDVATRDMPEVSVDDLDREWRTARKSFDEARARKMEVDRLYLAAATRLNTLDRMVKKVEQRLALERRAAAKSLAQSGIGSTMAVTGSQLVSKA